MSLRRFLVVWGCATYVTANGVLDSNVVSCGIARPTAITSGQITCTSATGPQQTADRLRIEGGMEGTIFEGCIASRPRNITTSLGGTHLCNGLNNNANPHPGATCTTQLDQASKEKGFTYDGSYDPKFQDYLITRISNSRQTASQFWGLLTNLMQTPKGGCQTEISTTGKQETLWAFISSQKNITFLKLTPEYQVIRLGTQNVKVTVKSTNGNGSPLIPVKDAFIPGGSVSDSNGVSTIKAPHTPGCYRYKASKSDTIRSNTFYLTVLASED